MNKRIKKKVSNRKKIWYIPDEYPCPVVTTTYHDYKFMHKKNQAYIVKFRHSCNRVVECSYEYMLRYLRRRTKSDLYPW